LTEDNLAYLGAGSTAASPERVETNLHDDQGRTYAVSQKKSGQDSGWDH
jgi:hypothetical protein